MTVAIRDNGEPHAYGNLLRNVVQKLDHDLAPYWIKTLERVPEPEARPDALKLLSNVFIGFAFIAIILAAVGIYGVLVVRHGPAQSRDRPASRALARMIGRFCGAVMRGALFQVTVGLVLGALFAPLMGRALKDGLLGMSPDDPAVYSLVLVLLIVTSMLASWIPARRALRDPAFVIGASLRIASGARWHPGPASGTLP